MKKFVKKQKLGFIATVCPDGTPNLSPKGTTTVWDDDHLVFADIHSRGTIQNLLNKSSIEINVVDIFRKKGYRFKGIGKVLSQGSLFEDEVFKDAGLRYTIKNIVLIKIERIPPLVSPVYHNDVSEDEVINRWSTYCWNSIYPDRENL